MQECSNQNAKISSSNGRIDSHTHTHTHTHTENNLCNDTNTSFSWKDNGDADEG